MLWKAYTRKYLTVMLIWLVSWIFVWKTYSSRIHPRQPYKKTALLAQETRRSVRYNETKLQVDPALLERLNLPPQTFHDVTPANVDDFVIVTGCSSNHFRESVDAVASVQNHFPNRTLYYYDLGLTQAQRKQVALWCNVVLRAYSPGRYPPHAAKLKVYSFKPMIIWEVLKKHGSLLWIDASIRIKTSDWSQVYSKVLQPGGGIYAPIDTGIPTLTTCHPAVYKHYFPVNITLAKDVFQVGSGTLLIYKTKDIYWNILHWWFLCALDPNCIAPTRQLRCTDLSERVGSRGGHDVTWAECHRFDQSALNVLLKNYFGHRPDYPSCYAGQHRNKNGLLDVNRWVTSMFKVKHCKT